ncbi:hypothetical protein CK203_041913 [Vitis vinifera]|uniref:Uncharacterized protein n=1 Tax=Vitis vinifera TaxID=29760 RepID=A0A438FYB6_VITVI|nr:hypothetical protein CK203_041913 [Vitis vinifera]
MIYLMVMWYSKRKYPIMDVAPEVEEVICPGDGGFERAWRSAGNFAR